MIRTPARTRGAAALLTSLAVLVPAGPAPAQTVPDAVIVEEPSQVATGIQVDRGVIDFGRTVQLSAFGPAGGDVTLFAQPSGRPVARAAIRQAVFEPLQGDPTAGVATWTLQPGETTQFFTDATGDRVEVKVRRTVTIGIRQANGIYTFSGAIDRPQAGVQVTVARLDAAANRVTGVASTSTTAGGRYEIRTGLPVGQAGYYALTAPTPDLLPGRSRLYGLIVPARTVIRPQQPTLTTPTVTIRARAAGGNVYTLSGRVTPGGSVPVTLAEIRSGRLVGVAGGRTNANGSYSFNVSLNRAATAKTRTFQVLTAAAQGLRAASSRPYGLVVPARAVVVNPGAETVSQRNARQKAASYLKFSGFSRSGLIRQLEFEGFSTADATYGTDAQRANWNTQALRKARSYLEFTSFSREGLIRQLEFEGFTRAEAEYGVRQVGL